MEILNNRIKNLEERITNTPLEDLSLLTSLYICLDNHKQQLADKIYLKEV
ncbi:hypothetical protein GSH19_05065 [Lactobacillus sp. S2-2]|nr:hypothetical protein [Lactobacillus sp. S2-2]MCF6515522.1 hypothetical protein [Lactobacillus sp. S2-2]